MVEIDIQIDEQEQRTSLKRLRKVSDELKGPVVTFALGQAAKSIVANMKLLAPVGSSGNLRKSIGRSKLSKTAAARLGLQITRPGQVAMIIGPNRKVDSTNWGWLANILESGAKAHAIKPKRKGGLKALGFGNKTFAKQVMHPGIRASRFMEKSLTVSEASIEADFFAAMKKKLDRIAA